MDATGGLGENTGTRDEGIVAGFANKDEDVHCAEALFLQGNFERALVASREDSLRDVRMQNATPGPDIDPRARIARYLFIGSVRMGCRMRDG